MIQTYKKILYYIVEHKHLMENTAIFLAFYSVNIKSALIYGSGFCLYYIAKYLKNHNTQRYIKKGK